MPDPLFAELYDDTETLNWDSADQVRERARRRTRRTRLVAGLASAAAVAVVATGAVAVARNPDPAPPLPPATNSPSPSPSVSPTPSLSPSPTKVPPSEPPESAAHPTSSPPSPDVPAAAMLQPADLPGWQRSRPARTVDALEFAASKCDDPDWLALKMPKLAERSESFQAGLDGGTRQQVLRFPDRSAAQFIYQVRADIESCGGGVDDFSVVDSGFAGEESLMINYAENKGLSSLFVMVRQGDLVSVVYLDLRTDQDDARVIGTRAAARLCAGTDAC